MVYSLYFRCIAKANMLCWLTLFLSDHSLVL